MSDADADAQRGQRYFDTQPRYALIRFFFPLSCPRPPRAASSLPLIIAVASLFFAHFHAVITLRHFYARRCRHLFPSYYAILFLFHITIFLYCAIDASALIFLRDAAYFALICCL